MAFGIFDISIMRWISMLIWTIYHLQLQSSCHRPYNILQLI